MDDHYRKLERMYHNAPINQLYKNELTVFNKTASIKWEVQESFFHAANSLHGSIYFKLLDDAAYFAAASMVKDVFIVTSNFTINLFRPVTSGVITSKGEIVSLTRNLIVAKSILVNEKGKLVAEGTGNFMKGSVSLTETLGYQ